MNNYYPCINTVPPPASLTLTSGSNNNNMVVVGDSVTLNCALVLNSAILESDLSLLNVSVQLTHPNGTRISLSSSVTGTTFTYTTTVNSFERSDSGNYTCTANIERQSTATYLIGIDNSMLPSDELEVTTGKN